MSMTLGEKLREAREARGFTIAEVAEQTRISGLYLESIENDDYRRLPGGIFNKGFVKSYAKFVGINDQEALADYSQLMAQAENADDDLKVYKPEVLTDDSGPSMLPTLILAVVILGAMTGGILFLVNYLRQPADEPTADAPSRPAGNASPDATPGDAPAAGDVPEMASLKVEVKATDRPVPLRATVDGSESNNSIAAGSSQTFEPKETLVLNYSRWNAPAVEMTINGKPITLPSEPLAAADKDRIIFTISKDTLAQIWTSGAISGSAPPESNETNTNTAAPVEPPAASTPTTTPARPTPAPRPSVAANANAAAPARTPAPRPAANTTRPAPTPARPAVNN